MKENSWFLPIHPTNSIRCLGGPIQPDSQSHHTELSQFMIEVLHMAKAGKLIINLHDKWEYTTYDMRGCLFTL